MHKLTTRLCRENQAVVIEDLNVKGMPANERRARGISDVGFWDLSPLDAPLRRAEVFPRRIRFDLLSFRPACGMAMFNLAIDSKLRARDLTKLRVCDVCHKEHVASRATIMQQKTQRPGNYRADSRERGGLDKAAGLHATDFNSPSRIHDSPHLSTRQYARLVHRWIASIGLDDTAYGTNTMRRTKRL